MQANIPWKHVIAIVTSEVVITSFKLFFNAVPSQHKQIKYEIGNHTRSILCIIKVYEVNIACLSFTDSLDRIVMVTTNMVILPLDEKIKGIYKEL